MKKILVTGASGFIGQHLIDQLLKKEVKVQALVRDQSYNSQWPSEVTIVHGDICDKNKMHGVSRGCDTIYHLAGKAHALSEIKADEKEYFAINVEGTRNVLEGAQINNVQRFVFFSSVLVFPSSMTECLDESYPAQPETIYGKTKLEAEKLVIEYGKNTNQHTVCLRLPLVYGPGNKGNLFRMISAIDKNRFPPLPHIDNHRSMVHVMNVVDAAVLAATSNSAKGQCYIVSDEIAYNTRELYEMLCHKLGKTVPSWHVPIIFLKTLGKIGDLVGRIHGKRFLFDTVALKKLTESGWYSSDKISQELAFSPSNNLENSLEELIDWYRKLKK